MKIFPLIKKLLSGVLVAFYLLFTCVQAKAVHFLGADVSWNCKGDSAFTITLTVYRDCNGIQASAQPVVLTPLLSNCSKSAYTLNGTLTNGVDVTPVCKKSCTRCSSPACSFQYGIQQWNEVVTAKFKATDCCKYKVEFTECCRNSAINTINTGSSFINLYLPAILNRCDTPCDNSPVFSNPPLSIIQTGQCYIFNQGAVDSDIDKFGNADSLAYYLVNPLTDSVTSVKWISPYNAKEPLDYGGGFGNHNGKWAPSSKICNGFHLDSITGDLYFKPTKAEIGVFAIQVQSWKKDSAGNPYLSSTITRDVQIIVMDSTGNHLPTLTGINGDSATDIDFCVDKYQCFSIYADDTDATDSVSLSWNNAIPGATFSANNKLAKHPTATFCWEPTQARTYPYYFVVNAQDNECPVNGKSSRAYAIHVHPRPEVNYSATLAACGIVTFRASPKPGPNNPGISHYLWQGPGSPSLYSTADSFVHKYRISGKYPYSLTVTSNSGCSYTYTYNDSIIIPKSVEVFLPEDTTVCTNTNMNISSTVKLNTGALSYKWSVNNVTLASTSSYINYTFTQAGDAVPVVLTVTDAGTGCTNYDSMKVYVTLPPEPNLPADIYACSGAQVKLNDTISKPATHTWQQYINGNWQTLGTVTTDSTIANDSGQYRVIVNYTGVQNCAGVADVHVHYNPLLDIDNDSIAVCAGDNVTLRAGDGDSAHTTWNWYDVTHGRIDARHTRYMAVHPGSLGAYYKVTAIQTENGITCTASGIIQAFPVPLPTITISSVPPQCFYNAPISLNNYVNINTYGDGEKSRTWSSVTSKAAANAISGNTFNPALSGGGNFYIRCMVITLSGCAKTDSLEIYVDSSANAGNNATLYTKSPLYKLNGIPAGGTWTGSDVSKDTTGNWYFNPALAGVGNFRLKYYYPGRVGCKTSDSVIMFVLPNKNFRAISDSFTNTDTGCTILFTDSSKTYSYDSISICGKINNWQWSFGDGSTDTIENPKHKYVVGGNYKVKLVVASSGGCTDSFSKTVYIDSACNPSLIAGFFVTNNCVDSPASFHDTSLSVRCGAINKWHWSFGDSGTDTLENPTHIYTKTGIYKVILDVVTAGGCKASTLTRINIDSCSKTGILPMSYTYFGIRIYPNPATNTLNIDAGTNTINSITVFDAVGREVYTNFSMPDVRHGKVNTVSIPTSSLPAGIYFLRLGIGDGYYRTRFVKE